jgi:endo-1,4-beta-mannosidase
MNDIKSRIYHHFFTRKKHFILGKPPLMISQGKEIYYIYGEFKDGNPWFRVDHGVSHIYFTDIDNTVDFIEQHKEKI